jgi:hypothetical protein
VRKGSRFDWTPEIMEPILRTARERD